MIQQRDFWVFVLLNVITCGIYGIFFWYMWNEDVNRICAGDGQEMPNYIIVLLLGLVTCGIYNFYWMYRQADRLQANALRYGVRIQVDGSSVLLWALLSLLTCTLALYYAYYLMVLAVNQIAPAYNAAGGYGGYGGTGYQNYQQGEGYQKDGYQGSGYQPGQGWNADGAIFTPVSGQITCLCGPEPNRETLIGDGETLILGQDGSVCNHIIMGNAIEAKHCSIVYRRWDNCYIVTDYSMGGTYRASDDTRLPTGGRTELTAGTVIYLGDRATMYRLG